jgi:hypothetical protein
MGGGIHCGDCSGLVANSLWSPCLPGVPKQDYIYEPLEAFGEGLTTRRPWNTTALAGVERLNGRVAMLGFAAALLGEWITGHGPAGQIVALLRWYLS